MAKHGKQKERRARHPNAALALKASRRHRPGHTASSGNSVERQKVMESIKAHELRDVNMPGINRGTDDSAPEWSLALARDVSPGVPASCLGSGSLVLSGVPIPGGEPNCLMPVVPNLLYPVSPFFPNPPLRKDSSKRTQAKRKSCLDSPSLLKLDGESNSRWL